jgi:ribosomal protein L16 Arg81 hydroxylase
MGVMHMFSRSSSSSASDLAKKRELEQKQLEQSMAECTKIVDSMRDLQPAAAERVRQRLDAYLKDHPKIPLDFKRKVTAQARTHECAANMRAADAALKKALGDARNDAIKERSRLIGEARNFSNKAASLGADEEFKAAVKRKIEIIMLTGGVEHEGPTIAKPLDKAPANPHHAKE